MSTRITVTVEDELAASGRRAVAEGRAASVSAWVNEALADKADRDRQLEAMAVAVADFIDEFGGFSDDELGAQLRADRDDAAAVRLRHRVG